MSGKGKGHYEWELIPKSKMTNGNVEQAVTGVDGPVLSVKYKDGEKKLVLIARHRHRSRATELHCSNAIFDWRGNIPASRSLR